MTRAEERAHAAAVDLAAAQLRKIRRLEREVDRLRREVDRLRLMIETAENRSAGTAGDVAN